MHGLREGRDGEVGRERKINRERETQELGVIEKKRQMVGKSLALAHSDPCSSEGKLIVRHFRCKAEGSSTKELWRNVIATDVTLYERSERGCKKTCGLAQWTRT